MFVPIANEPRAYAWGSRTLLADYLGRDASGDPEAELWLGAHPGCPSTVAAGEHAGRGLGEALEAWGRPQPALLLKALAAAEPLSLQAHPDASEAQEGFAREDRLGIARDAPERNYRDPHPKPELIVAVTPFEALSGFRPAGEALRVLDALAAADARLAPVAARVRAGDALAWLLSGGDEVAAAVAAAEAAAPAIAAAHPVEADTVDRLARTHPGDPGILVALLLNRVSLAPGEALYLPAGNLHAYLEGLAIELMGPSDNVLRGGLTPKHVDVPELLRVVDTTPLVEPRLASTPLEGAVAYRPAAPFELRRIAGVHRVEGGVRGLLLAARPTRVAIDGAEHELPQAAGAWIDAAEPFEVRSDEAWLALERDTP
ncbi:mannose-6-phosphate isomerase, class I [Agrococcus sp. SCSIO52902]|uniref:mannose-6-phosphate isomerase, class I n=1 Tax=Agrococcus sp. SCSIO52902 TaxID=2933290 RepID=UPI001FF2A359|nr:mannose-6-phosphate isomerase, class I [Agrococcus sp. SCSIO52902]UOW01164.1 mannose-6-phosphate isomerase, class I [Agrococcus sp. SCSIO52902]